MRGSYLARFMWAENKVEMLIQPSKQKVTAGQAVYTPGTLLVYDIVVLGISNSFIWKCPSSRIEKHYNDNISDSHLEVGVGTGYFPDRCKFPSEQPRVGLMDMNPNTLEFASKRIARFKIFSSLLTMSWSHSTLLGSTTCSIVCLDQSRKRQLHLTT